MTRTAIAHATNKAATIPLNSTRLFAAPFGNVLDLLMVLVTVSTIVAAVFVVVRELVAVVAVARVAIGT